METTATSRHDLATRSSRLKVPRTRIAPRGGLRRNPASLKESRRAITMSPRNGTLGGRQPPTLLDHLVDRPGHIERLLGEAVVFAVEDLAEAAHRLAQRDVAPGAAGGLRRHLHPAGEEGRAPGR